MRPAVPVVLIAFLLTPGVADAKRVETARVCGASQCFTFNRANSGNKLVLFEEWGGIRSAPSSAAPWYRLRISFAPEGDEPVEPFTVTHAYVPSADLLRVRDDGGVIRWLEVNDDLRPVLRNVAAELEPLPAASVPGIDARRMPPAALPARPQPPPARDAGTAWGWFVLAGAGMAALAIAIRRHRPMPHP
jgi:hypothetical protein